MDHFTKINLDPEGIEWPDGTISKAPVHEKKGRGVDIRKEIPQVNTVYTVTLFMNMGQKLRSLSKISRVTLLLSTSKQTLKWLRLQHLHLLVVGMVMHRVDISSFIVYYIMMWTF